MTKLNREIVKKHMLNLTDFVTIYKDEALIDCLEKITKKEIGVACVINKSNKLIGILTDGDIRRMIMNLNKPMSAFFNDRVSTHMNKKPFSIKENFTVIKALSIMGKKRIWDLPVTNSSNQLVGLLHLHPVAQYFNDKFK